MKTKLFSLFVLLLTLAFTATPARADGIIIPEPPICDPAPCPMPRPYHRPRPVAWEAICRWGWSRLVGLFAVASREMQRRATMVAAAVAPQRILEFVDWELGVGDGGLSALLIST